MVRGEGSHGGCAQTLAKCNEGQGSWVRTQHSEVDSIQGSSVVIGLYYSSLGRGTARISNRPSSSLIAWQVSASLAFFLHKPSGTHYPGAVAYQKRQNQWHGNVCEQQSYLRRLAIAKDDEDDYNKHRSQGYDLGLVHGDIAFS